MLLLVWYEQPYIVKCVCRKEVKIRLSLNVCPQPAHGRQQANMNKHVDV